jgi:hypothetical protein
MAKKEAKEALYGDEDSSSRDSDQSSVSASDSPSPVGRRTTARIVPYEEDWKQKFTEMEQ